MRMILSRWLRSTRRCAPPVVLAVLAACGGGESGSGSTDPVLATTSIWADVTSQVGCGTSIPSLIPAGADPHTFEPSLRDRERIEHASTVVSNGLGLEDNLDDLLDTARDDGVDVIELANAIDIITHDDTDHDEADDHDEDDGHDAGDDGHGHAHGLDGDPHVWQDPLRVAGTLDTIASALAAHDITTCTDAYRRELVDLDDEIEATLAVVPPASRVLVTSHDSLAYFADRYGFEIVGTVIPSTSTLAETNPADLADLADTIAARAVPAIFTDQLESSADADALADRLGVAVVPLVTDALTDDSGTDTYTGMLRTNARAIAQALAP